jgi:hypothetical protein
LFFDLLDRIGSPFLGKNVSLSTGLANAVSAEKSNTPVSYYLILILILIGYAIYFWVIPQLRTNYANQGGKLLVNYPVQLNVQSNIGTYDLLNNTSSNQYDYQYAISFWFFLESVGANANKASTQYTSILNYGGKPNILYNAVENKLMITMSHDGSISRSKKIDTDGNIILYIMDDLLLQKWNNMIFNYNGGTVDIFFNGILLKTINEVVPIMKKDILTVGADNGVYGEVCNVNYFNTQITMTQVNNLYEIVKDRKPPIASPIRKSIIGLTEAGLGIKNPTSFVYTPKNTVSVEKEPNTPVPDISLNEVSVDPTVVDLNYLSEKWFFDTQGDKFNG